MKRFRITVTPNKANGGWDVVYPGGRLWVWRKVDAVARARELGRQNEPAQVVVKGRDGRIRFEHTYGADPRRHKG